MASLEPLRRHLNAAPPWPDVTRPGWLWAYGLFVAVTLTAGIALLLSDVNVTLFYGLNSAGTVIPSGVWQWTTFLGDTNTALVVVLLIALRRPQLLWVTLFAAIAGTLLTHGFKDLLGVPRPPAALDPETFRIIGKAYHNGSFPSGHTLTAFTLAGAVAPFLRRPSLRVAVFAAAALVGLSRIMVGVHWPADVCAGAAGGVFSGWLGIVAARHWPAGMQARVHVWLAAFFTLAAVVLFNRDGHYPAALWLADGLAVAGVVAAVAVYWWPMVRPSARDGTGP